MVKHKISNMEKEILLQKIRSAKYCLMAHPDNEPDSEFADRIDDLQEIEDSLAEHQARQQPVSKTLDECKDEVAKQSHWEAHDGYTNWNEMESHLEQIGMLSWGISRMHEVAELYANQSEQGWVDVEKLRYVIKTYMANQKAIYKGENIMDSELYRFASEVLNSLPPSPTTKPSKDENRN